MSRPDLSEPRLARCLVEYLRAEEWSVYQEVAFQGRVIDVVATRGPVLSIYECKQALGLPLLEQCRFWTGYAHFVWAIAWHLPRKRDGKSFALEISQHFGIGFHGFDPRDGAYGYPRSARMHRRPVGNLRDLLVPEQQSGNAAAGTNRGAVWTDWRRTCLALADVVRAEPGIRVKDAIAKTNHHYRTDQAARSSMTTWLRKGRVAGVAMSKEDGRLVLRPIAAKQLEARA